MKYREAYLQGSDILKQNGIIEYEIDARLLLEFICKTKRHDMILNPDKELTKDEEDKFFQYIEDRSKRNPLQYIIGEQDFMGHTFKVNKHVLIPRQDTEILVEEAQKYIRPNMKVLDMCTGSGCILLSLLQYEKAAKGIGVDISIDALKVASFNQDKLDSDNNTKVEAHFIQSNLFESVEGLYDIIISNPPYIRSDVIKTLEVEVKDKEPMQALDGFEDGLYFYREIILKSRSYLKDKGILLFEIGYDQANDVSEMMKAAGFKNIYVLKDLARLDRVVVGSL